MRYSTQARSMYMMGTLCVPFLFPLYSIRFRFFGVPTNILESSVCLLFLLGISNSSIRTIWWQSFQSLSLKVAIIIMGFCAAAIVSTLISPHPLTSLGILKSWIAIPILIGWLVYSYRHAADSFKKHNISIERTIIYSGVVASLTSLVLFQPGQRLSGIYDVPNSLALYLAPIVVLAIWHRLWALACIMACTLLLTQSVAGMAITAGVSICMIINQKKNVTKKIGATFGIILISLCFLFLSGRASYLMSPLQNGSPNSISVRLQLWDISLQLVKEHPIFGVGLGTFEPAYQGILHERFYDYNQKPEAYTKHPPLPEFVFRDPHNWILSFWLNLGLLGLAAFCMLHIFAFKKTLQPAHLALFTLLLFGLVDTIYWKNDLAALHWTLLALATSQAKAIPSSD